MFEELKKKYKAEKEGLIEKDIKIKQEIFGKLKAIPEVKRIIERTDKYWNGSMVKEEIELSAKGQKLLELLPEFGCNIEIIRKAFSVLINEELLKVPENEMIFRKGVIVVVKSNYNGHDYGDGEVPVYLANDNEGGHISAIMHDGNRLPSVCTFYRRPLEHEIADLLLSRNGERIIELESGLLIWLVYKESKIWH